MVTAINSRTVKRRAVQYQEETVLLPFIHRRLITDKPRVSRKPPEVFLDFYPSSKLIFETCFGNLFCFRSVQMQRQNIGGGVAEHLHTNIKPSNSISTAHPSVVSLLHLNTDNATNHVQNPTV
jgi:hypothetical protein